jgi:hypothetical protein
VLEEDRHTTPMRIEDVPIAAQVDTSERAALAKRPHTRAGAASFGKAMPEPA